MQGWMNGFLDRYLGRVFMRVYCFCNMKGCQKEWSMGWEMVQLVMLAGQTFYPAWMWVPVSLHSKHRDRLISRACWPASKVNQELAFCSVKENIVKDFRYVLWECGGILIAASSQTLRMPSNCTWSLKQRFFSYLLQPTYLMLPAAYLKLPWFRALLLCSVSIRTLWNCYHVRLWYWGPPEAVLLSQAHLCPLILGSRINDWLYFMKFGFWSCGWAPGGGADFNLGCHSSRDILFWNRISPWVLGLRA